MGPDPYARGPGRFYSFYIERPRWGRVLGRLIWGSDFTPMYRSLEGLGRLAPGSTILDAAAGAGLTLDWLDPSVGIRYVGVDLSPSMLSRARTKARRLGVDARLILADVGSLPLPAGLADTCVLYNALHCFDDPARAVVEVTRCVKPGGEMVGSMLVRRAVGRSDWLLTQDQRPGGMTGPGGDLGDLRGWLEDAALVEIGITRAGAMAVFTARRPAAP